jgi:hypothetical protein
MVPVGVENVPSPTSLPLQVDASGSFAYVVGGGARPGGVVEVALDDPDFAEPALAELALDGGWQLALADGALAPGPHTLYARQRIDGGNPSPVASVAFEVAGLSEVDCLEDDDPRIDYGNGWHRVADADASAGQFRYRNGNSPQGGFALDFTVPVGRSGAVSYDYATSQKGGAADLYLDGVLQLRVDYSGPDGTTRDPRFGASFRSGALAPGAHRLELRSPNGAAFVDRFCLESSRSTAAPASTPGATTSDDRSLGAGQLALAPLALPAGTTALGVAVESTPALPLQVALVDAQGLTLATAKATHGVAVLETPAHGGAYALRVTNLGLGPVRVWTLATPLVTSSTPP